MPPRINKNEQASNIGATQPPAPLYSLAELRHIEFHEPEPIIDGILNEGETILIVGRPKMGKSRLVAQAGLSIARGTSFLLKTVSRPRRVLILDLENRPAVIKDRFRRMANADTGGDSRIFVVAPESLSESNVSLGEPGFSELEYLIDKTEADVLMVDTWRLLLGAGDENKAEVVVNGLRSLSRLRNRRRSLSIILVHHLRKQQTNASVSLSQDPYTWIESVSGHHALVGHVDACFGLDRESSNTGGEPMIVFGGVARNAASSSMILEDDADTLLFSPTDSIDAFRSLLTTKESEFFREAQRLRRFGFEDLIRACKTTNRKTVTTMLDKAKAQGVIEKTGAQYRFVDPSGDL
jgi:hypothetical protein